MRLSVPTNFDDALLDGIACYPVADVYGKLTRDPIGGGRASFMLPPVDMRRLREHVAHAHRLNIRFNYLLNAACMDNQEATRPGYRRIRRFIDRLCEAGIDSVTVSLPAMLVIIKTHYPHLAARVGVFAQVNSVRRAQLWEEMGADCICLDSLQVNRELGLLARIRESVRCDLQLLANTNCIQNCAFSPAHMVALSHGSQQGHRSGGFLVDACYLSCARMKLREPVNYLRSEWIRPEDLHHYEAIGYKQFKLVERNSPTGLMIRRVRAYAERRYDGNLMDLIGATGQPRRDGDRPRSSIGHALRYLLRPRLINPRWLLKLRRLALRQGMLCDLHGPAPVAIDNRALDGFFDHFVKTGGCRERDCEACRYCHRVAEEVVKIDPAYRRECLDRLDEVLEGMRTGAMWRYLPDRPGQSDGVGASPR